MRSKPEHRRGSWSAESVRSLSWLSLLGAAAACSVYSASDLAPLANGGGGGSGATPSGGDQAVAGAATGGGSGGGGTNGGGSTSTAGDGGSSGSAVGAAGGEAGMAGEAGANPGDPDECPDDPTKTAPGVCGCGIPDTTTTELSSCQSLRAALAHRYDFEGTGTVVTDRVGSSNGVVVGAMLSQLEGRGVVSLTGGTTGPYVDLPNGLISSLTDVTIETWLTWRGGAVWQRIFDFGDSTATAPEDNPAAGNTYLFATPESETHVALASYSHEGNADGQELEATASAPLSKTLSQVVVVANGAAQKLVLYIDGSKISEQGWTGSLAQINDVNVWLGRSQYAQDPELDAVLHDFRVYEAALSDAQIATAYLGGPDPDFLADDAARSFPSATR